MCLPESSTITKCATCNSHSTVSGTAKRIVNHVLTTKRLLIRVVANTVFWISNHNGYMERCRKITPNDRSVMHSLRIALACRSASGFSSSFSVSFHTLRVQSSTSTARCRYPGGNLGDPMWQMSSPSRFLADFFPGTAGESLAFGTLLGLVECQLAASSCGNDHCRPDVTASAKRWPAVEETSGVYHRRDGNSRTLSRFW